MPRDASHWLTAYCCAYTAEKWKAAKACRSEPPWLYTTAAPDGSRGTSSCACSEKAPSLDGNVSSVGLTSCGAQPGLLTASLVSSRAAAAAPPSASTASSPFSTWSEKAVAQTPFGRSHDDCSQKTLPAASATPPAASPAALWLSPATVCGPPATSVRRCPSVFALTPSASRPRPSRSSQLCDTRAHSPPWCTCHARSSHAPPRSTAAPAAGSRGSRRARCNQPLGASVPNSSAPSAAHASGRRP